MLRSFALLGSSLLVAVRGNLVLFPWTSNDGSFGNAVDAQVGFGNSQPISSECASALNQTVACDPQMQLLAASGYVVSLNGASSGLCDASCKSSLVAYHDAVTAACGASRAFDTYPNTWRGDIIYDYFNMVCDTDPSTGEYCPQWLKEQYAANGNPKLEDLPDSVLCSHCQINNMRTVQNSIFLGYNGAMVETYRKIFARCNVDAATTPKPPPEETFPNTADGANRTCLSGNTYMSQAGDTCHSIALAKSVAEDTLASINDLGVNCTRMTLESSSKFNLCLPKTCTTAQTGPTDNCWSLSAQYNISFAQFRAFNPTINNDCSNLRPDGTVVCVTSPDGSYTPVPLPGSNSSWSLGEYAESIVPAPGSTPFGTTDRCGAYYQVQTADTCMRVSIAAKVSVDLFQEINPSIDAGCTNLVPGLWYCVHPTVDWNDVPSSNPTTSTTVAPPAPTPTGTTTQCYRWHVVVSGDNCALLQNTLGITMAQLVAWNPDLKADCSNLLLGDAYCVQGPSSSSVPTTTTSTTSTSNTPTTTAGPQVKQVQGWEYSNCYIDADTRLLPVGKGASSQMTPSTCAQLCCGYRHFGVENGEECWCGDSLDATKQAPTGGECSTPCAGDGGALCGGGWRITVYEVDEVPPVNEGGGWEFRNCYVDADARLLPVGKGTSAQMTPTMCAQLCDGYRFLGVENGEECWCGDSLDTTKQAPAEECSTPCSGDGHVLCGGGWRISVYEDMPGDSSSPVCRSTAPASSSTAATSTTPPPTPSSTPTACTQTYTVQSGDWCAKIWEAFGLSESAFRALNPSLSPSCDLAIGQVLCVAAPSACKATYTVVSGDWCSKIWEQFGLTEGQFRGLNPGLDANCDISVGQRLCVG